MTDAPMTRPGEVMGIPKLVIKYPTDMDRIADLLPPGMTPHGDPIVQIGIYCVPVLGEPEFGISTKVPATWGGLDGQYSLGIGIDQEAAIFGSRETNGQPKFPCSIKYFRLGDKVQARATHQGYTFATYEGTVSGERDVDGQEVEDNEWWIKVSRAVGGAEKQYDFPPHVVRVRTAGIAKYVETLDGDFALHHSPWDPQAELLPIKGEATAELVTTQHTAREITLDEPLDPDAFWPYADTIGGSRFLGERGAPPARP
ncbi:MAG: acetoacetate decarboxylase family protein [Actinomycetia bacterium]|nr:acetoacetate decarboxylase family protein [Actinomycetes bacterium]